MFETAELGRTVGKQEYAEKAPQLRAKLLEAQARLQAAPFPVLVLFAGVDGAGKGECANTLSSWMDPHGIVTRAFAAPSEEELERPEFWRYWRVLPPRGRVGLFLSAWYSLPLLDRVYRRIDDAGLEERLERIAAFERTLADDGALILKLWMHLGRKAQRKRFETLEADPLRSWRVTKKDWKHWRMYDRFVAAAERIIMRTSTGGAPWHIVDGGDQRYRSLEVGTLLLDALQRRLDAPVAERAAPAAPSGNGDSPSIEADGAVTVLSRLDLSLELPKKRYERALQRWQGRLNLLHRRARASKVSLLVVFEGWDAAGKGGVIRRVVAALDARDYEVIPIAAPSDEERSRHYLWRFWRHVPRAGRIAIFDRSWYGRVLVERVEGFATDAEWRRAYAEIRDFERQLVEHGIVLVKLWLHITPEEQARRFEARQEIAYKRYKLTEEDWRNRDKRRAYEIAVHDMVERTSAEAAPWVLVEAEDKRHARIKVLRTICDALGGQQP